MLVVFFFILLHHRQSIIVQGEGEQLFDAQPKKGLHASVAFLIRTLFHIRPVSKL